MMSAGYLEEAIKFIGINLFAWRVGNYSSQSLYISHL